MAGTGTTNDCPNALRLPAPSVEVLPERVRRPAFLDIVSLTVCLLGLLGLIFVMWKLKTGASGISRTMFLGTIAMVCAPFYVAFVRTPKIPFLFAPIIAIFLLYPIAAPHAVIYSTDPIFNSSFTEDVLDSGFWIPGAGNAFARTYSFYPIGNVFVGYIVLNAPPLTTDIGYLWIEPIVRALALPAIVYAIGRRIFGPRTAVVAVLLYLGTPSILFNAPVQQGFGTIFFGLSLLALFMLTQAGNAVSQFRAQLLFGLVAGGIVMTHHLSSYIFAFWLAGLGAIIARRAYRTRLPVLQIAVLFAYFFLLLFVYVARLSYPIFSGHEQTLFTVVANLVAPEQGIAAPGGSNLGRTFSPIEIAWLAGSLFGLFLLAVFTIRRYRQVRQQPFAVANGIVAAFVIFITLPLIATPLNYVPLRINEYSGFVVTPFAAATLIRWARSDFWKSTRGLSRLVQDRAWLPPAAALLISAVMVMGGNLAPVTMRTYFETFNSRTTDSPLYLGADGLRSSDWAQAHFSMGRVWGDQLAVDVFSGFADLPSDFGSSRLFANTSLNASAWNLLTIGDYIVVDRWMVILKVNFLHESLHEPLSPAQVEKFATDPHLALVYQDQTFSVYRVMSLGP